MKKHLSIWLWLIALVSIFASCEKDKTEPSELSKLPPATQTGANTFGCLVNGKAFTNFGFDGNYPNYRLFVDPSFQNGAFQIRVYNFKDSKYESININSNNIQNVGLYNVSGNNGPIYIDYSNENSNCSFFQSSNCFIKGNLIVSRYDIGNGIFSGTFSFILKDPNSACDTIKITDGRFDKKF